MWDTAGQERLLAKQRGLNYFECSAKAVQTEVSAFLEQNLLLRRQVGDLQEMVKTLQQEATDAQVEIRLRKSQCARVSKQLRQLKEQHEAAD